MHKDLTLEVLTAVLEEISLDGGRQEETVIPANLAGQPPIQDQTFQVLLIKAAPEHQSSSPPSRV